MDHVVGGKFKLGRKIGSGSFGELYLGRLFFKKIYYYKFITFVQSFPVPILFCICSHVTNLMISVIHLVKRFRCQCTEWRRSSYQVGMLVLLPLRYSFLEVLNVVSFIDFVSTHLYFSLHLRFVLREIN